MRYRNHWYYIDDRDFQSKRAFTFLMVLFSLTETGGRESLPLVTIPGGRLSQRRAKQCVGSIAREPEP